MEGIYEVLHNLDIPYEKLEHPPVHKVADTVEYYKGMDAGKSKNLFLRNAKGDTHYLVVLQADKRLDLKKLAEQIGESKLSFSSEERLLKYLGVTPGSVSPFGLINNEDKSVRVIVDYDLLHYGKLGYHPNINTATLIITTEDFKKFLKAMGNPVQYLDL